MAIVENDVGLIGSFFVEHISANKLSGKKFL
jgi:hypothetical protein